MKIETFEIINLKESGMRMSVEYEILNKGDIAEVSEYEIRYRTGGGDERVLMLRSNKDIESMLKILNDCKIASWDGFYGKHPKFVLDGTMFRFNATVNGGKTISASGSENFPKHYHEFTHALYEILKDAEIDSQAD